MRKIRVTNHDVRRFYADDISCWWETDWQVLESWLWKRADEEV